MINHMRTLLINSDPVIGFGSEYTPEAFRPLPLPQQLHTVRRVLLPDGSTPYQINYRTLLLMQLLHHPDLEPYVFMFDPRITYSLNTSDFNTLRLGGLTVTKDHADSDGDTVLNTFYRTGYDTREHGFAGGDYTWVVSSVDDEHIKINTDKSQLTYLVPMDKKISEPITLLPQLLSISLRDNTGRLTGTFRYTIRLQLPSVFDTLETVRQLEQLDRGGHGTAVFEPWDLYTRELADLRDVWYQGSEPLLRLGAFITAYLIQLERIRRYTTSADAITGVG